MKTIRFILISLVLGIGLGAISRPTLAREDEVKLIGVEDGLDNEHLCADIIGDSVVVGAHRVGIAKFYVGNGEKWERAGGTYCRSGGYRLRMGGSPHRPP